MFQSLRAGTPLYVLHKSVPRLEIGEVLSVGTPQPQFGQTVYQAGMTYQPQKTLVDIKVKIGNETIDLQKLPSEAVIADFGDNSMVISESREAILNEIETIRKGSEKVLESIDFHNNVVEQCSAMIAELNPHIRQEAEQRKEIDNMKNELSEIKNTMQSMQGMLAKALNKKIKED